MEEKQVSYYLPIIPQSIEVQEGDIINSGDRLITIDQEKTRAMLLANISDLLASREVFSEFNIHEINPDNLYGNLSAIIPDAFYAPTDGVVSSVNVIPYSPSNPQEPLVTIAKDSNLVAVLDVPQESALKISEGQIVKISCSAINDVIYGTITNIMSTTSERSLGFVQTNVMEAIAVIHEDTKLKPGFTITADIVIQRDECVTVVPYEAVFQDDNNREYVMIKKGNRVHARMIQTGRELESGFEVISGLSSTDVVINNDDNIRDGDFVISKHNDY